MLSSTASPDVSNVSVSKPRSFLSCVGSRCSTAVTKLVTASSGVPNARAFEVSEPEREHPATAKSPDRRSDAAENLASRFMRSSYRRPPPPRTPPPPPLRPERLLAPLEDVLARPRALAERSNDPLPEAPERALSRPPPLAPLDPRTTLAPFCWVTLGPAPPPPRTTCAPALPPAAPLLTREPPP